MSSPVSLPGSNLEPITTYMNALAVGDPIQNVSDLCRRIPISRTTFYRQFESLEDLDTRFLRLYFQATYRGPQGNPGTYASMAGALRATLDAMDLCPRFFRSILVDRTPPQYADRWFQVVDAHFAGRLAFADIAPRLPRWQFQFHLALGVAHQLFVAGVQGDPSERDTLVKATMDFLWAGTQGVIDNARGLPSSAERHLTSWMDQMRGRL